MLAIKIVIIVLFIVTWAYSRNSRRLSIYDVFCCSLLITYGPYFIFNPSAHSAWTYIEFTPSAVLMADILLIMMFSTGIVFQASLGAYTRGVFNQSSVRYESRIKNSVAKTKLLWKLALLFSFVLVLFFYSSSVFIDYRLKTFDFFSGELTASEYALARRVNFEGTAVSDIIGRLRFSIFPVLFVLLLCRDGIYKGIRLSTLGLSFAFFLLLPLSLSKLPVLYYFGYLVLFYIPVKVISNLSISKILTYGFVSIVLSVFVISYLYTIQYAGVAGFESIWGRSISLALERVWGETYSAILRYVTVYPNSLPHTGLSGIGLIATLLGQEVRNPDIEVPSYFFGAGVLTSNPGVFMLGGFAAFGLVGGLLYSVSAFFLVFLLDKVRCMLKTPILARAYFAVLAINVTFLAQLSLPTALLSYGLAVAPIAFLVIDRWLASAGKAKGLREGALEPTQR